MSAVAGATEWLAGWSQSIQTSYGVDPRIFIGLVLVTVPPFYLALALAVRAFIRAHRAGVRARSDSTFVAATSAVVALWLLPYGYVALFGRLPWWGWAAFVAILVTGGYRLVRSGRGRAARLATGREAGDE